MPPTHTADTARAALLAAATAVEITVPEVQEFTKAFRAYHEFALELQREASESYATSLSKLIHQVNALIDTTSAKLEHLCLQSEEGSPPGRSVRAAIASLRSGMEGIAYEIVSSSDAVVTQGVSRRVALPCPAACFIPPSRGGGLCAFRVDMVLPATFDGLFYERMIALVAATPASQNWRCSVAPFTAAAPDDAPVPLVPLIKRNWRNTTGGVLVRDGAAPAAADAANAIADAFADAQAGKGAAAPVAGQAAAALGHTVAAARRIYTKLELTVRGDVNANTPYKGFLRMLALPSGKFPIPIADLQTARAAALDAAVLIPSRAAVAIAQAAADAATRATIDDGEMSDRDIALGAFGADRAFVGVPMTVIVADAMTLSPAYVDANVAAAAGYGLCIGIVPYDPKPTQATTIEAAVVGSPSPTSPLRLPRP